MASLLPPKLCHQSTTTPHGLGKDIEIPMRCI